MVLEAFNLISFVARFIFNFLNLPDFIIYQNFLGEIAYFVLFVSTFILSHFLEKKQIIIIFISTITVAFIFGGFYLTLLSLIILLPWIFIIRQYTGAPDYQEEEPINLGLPRKEKKSMPPRQKIYPYEKQSKRTIKRCPRCNSPLTYLREYGRYYCFNCQKYA